MLNDETVQTNNLTGKYIMEFQIEPPTTIHNFI